MTFALLSITLAIAAFFDGLTTASAIHAGAVEDDPLMVLIYGTDTPSNSIIFVRGAIVIGLEILLGFLLSHFSHPGALFVKIGFLAQTATHVFLAIRNHLRG